MDRQVIYISSYPKSGSTWLTRLLADILNSPSGGSMPEEDSKEIATEGQDRPGSYIVRKGHFVLVNGEHSVVPSPHRLAWENITDERIVFLIRDPRDICVSGAWHWNKSTSREAIEHFLERMIKGDVARCGRWDEYYSQHDLIYKITDRNTWVRYEDLLEDTHFQLSFNLSIIGLRPVNDIYKAIHRQSFATRKAQIGNDEQELRRQNMRKGIAGDWKNHFTSQMNGRIWNEFGWMMEKLGYDTGLSLDK